MNQRLSRTSFAALALLYFVALVLLIFGKLLWTSGWATSGFQMDIVRYFVPIRTFTFDQIRAGRLPLWNPYLLGGTPALSNFQYAIFYPPNWLHLLLPADQAINIIAALHIALAGWLTCLWCRARGSGAIASLLGGTLFMFHAPLNMRLSGGHLPFICAMAWTPLLFMCVDAIIEQHHAVAVALAGSAALALQLLAGYPQPAYFTFLAIVVYGGIRLVRRPGALRGIALITAMYAVGGALAAGQVIPGLDTARELVRGQLLPFDFATSYSLPPENLITLFAPQFFGDNFNAPYVGRWSTWEVSMFIGGAGVFLAVWGACQSRTRREFALVVTLVLALLMAMGRYTPIYQLAMHSLPGFAHLRVPSRFTAIFALLVSVLAATGYDGLWQTHRLRAGALTATICCAVFVVAGLLLRASADLGENGLWGTIVLDLLAKNEGWLQAKDVTSQSDYFERSARFASQQLFTAAFSFLQIGLVLLLAKRRRAWLLALAAITLEQVWTGATWSWQSARPHSDVPVEWKAEIAKLQPGDRLIIAGTPEQNIAMPLGVENVAGYEPSLLARWANLVGPLVGNDPLDGKFKVTQIPPSPLWAMLRVGAVAGRSVAFEFHPMPRLNLINQFEVVESSEQSLRAVRQPDFDPRKLVILEQQPDPKPDSASPELAGEVRLVRMTCNELEISAELSRNSILLVTDGFSRGWRARELEPGPQQSYQVLPANHALRAIPLAAGKHHILLEYRPASVPIGIGVSLVAGIGWCVAGGAIALRARRRAAREAAATVPQADSPPPAA